MGRGIPAPTPPDKKRGVGALPPVLSIHRRVIDRSRTGCLAHVYQWAAHGLPHRIKCDGGGWGAAHKYAWRTALPPVRAPTRPPHGDQARASGAAQPLKPEGYDKVESTSN
uniref:Uncharacterized protein n=1 Tax=Oryza barthii TaxID=65489 RepID=A0A0D3GMW2_9ORYZ